MIVARHIPSSWRNYIPSGTSRFCGTKCCRWASTSTRPGKVIFSGIQPTGATHLGNYLGALQQWVKIQNTSPPSTQLFFSIVDLHAITSTQDNEELRKWKKETLATLLAVGIDPERSAIFYQSSVSAHSELMWILSCTSSMGYLSRMTQWKSKLGLHNASTPFDLEDPDKMAKLKLGLFSYPVLQAADILVHGTTHVPVGADQAQHLEFARESVTNFNSAFGPVLQLPETLLSPAKRVMSLRDPTAKMSKSAEHSRSKILLIDTPEEIQVKFGKAFTDSRDHVSYDPIQRPGVSNLLDIMTHFDLAKRSPEELARSFRGARLGDLKKAVAESVSHALSDIRLRFHELMRDENSAYLETVASAGAARARANAELTMSAVRMVTGLG